MTGDQIIIYAILLGAVILFIWGPLRFDLVAFLALIASVLFGLVPTDQAFEGFAHPAVITVAAVLIISRGLTASGAIDLVARFIVPQVKNVTLQIAGMSGFSAILSAMMNNVGALALLMPATIDAARKSQRSPSLLLMPLSFATILGGMVTLIGTPPNIIIGNYRADALGEPFSMFDFTPVGIVVAAVGVAFLSLAGWRLVPKERQSKSAPDELFDIDKYVSEVRVSKGNDHAGKPLSELDGAADKHDVRVAGIIRGRNRMLRTSRRMVLQEKDILILEAGPKELDKFSHDEGFEIIGEAPKDRSLLSSEDVSLVEAVVSADSSLVGRQIGDLRLRSRYGLNLLGVSRQGKAIRSRLHKVSFEQGDVLLLQGNTDTMGETMSRLGLLPLAERGFNVGTRHQAWQAAGLLAGAVIIASLGLLNLTIALAIAAFGMAALRIVALRDMYEAIDWPVIVLVAAMIPVGGALQTTGATQVIANGIVGLSAGVPAIVVLGVMLMVTMTLSDVMNNAATAVIMAPVAVSMATQLGANPDAFLMAVAVGASCAFLTPIGHKNNALIMGPGGYQFGDYWRMGLPLEILIVLAGTPMIAWVWGI